MTAMDVLKREKVKLVKQVEIGPNLVLVVGCGDRKATRVASLIRQNVACSATTGTRTAEGSTIWLLAVSL